MSSSPPHHVLAGAFEQQERTQEDEEEEEQEEPEEEQKNREEQNETPYRSQSPSPSSHTTTNTKTATPNKQYQSNTTGENTPRATSPGFSALFDEDEEEQQGSQIDSDDDRRDDNERASPKKARRVANIYLRDQSQTIRRSETKNTYTDEKHDHIMAHIPKGIHMESQRYETGQRNMDEEKGGAHVRWMYDEHKNIVSNSRFVRWEDDSMSLQVGEEFFDIVDERMRDAQYLLIPSDKGMLESQLQFGKVLKFRPAVLRQVKKDHQTKTKIRVLHATKDPEQERRQVEKAQGDKIRAMKRSENQRARHARRLDETSSIMDRHSNAYDNDTNDVMGVDRYATYERDDFVVDDDDSEDYDEDEDDEDEESVEGDTNESNSAPQPAVYKRQKIDFSDSEDE